MLIIFLLLGLILLFIVIKNKYIYLPKKIINNGNINPLDVLKTRLSDGEITKKEFNQIRKNLGI